MAAVGWFMDLTNYSCSWLTDPKSPCHAPHPPIALGVGHEITPSRCRRCCARPGSRPAAATCCSSTTGWSGGSCLCHRCGLTLVYLVLKAGTHAHGHTVCSTRLCCVLGMWGGVWSTHAPRRFVVSASEHCRKATTGSRTRIPLSCFSRAAATTTARRASLCSPPACAASCATWRVRCSCASTPSCCR